MERVNNIGADMEFDVARPNSHELQRILEIRDPCGCNFIPGFCGFPGVLSTSVSVFLGFPPGAADRVESIKQHISSDLRLCKYEERQNKYFSVPKHVPSVAKTAQGFLEGKIRELENVLKHAVVIQEKNGPANAVDIGRTVVIREVGTDFDEEYTIVGSMEADPTKGRISHSSPMGAALLKKRSGDEVVVESPGGEILFEIVNIS